MNIILAPLLHSLFSSLIDFKTGNFLFRWGNTWGKYKWKVKRILLFTRIGFILDSLHVKVPVRLRLFAFRGVFLRFVVVQSHVSFSLNHPPIFGELFLFFALDFNFFGAVIYLHFDVIATQSLLRRLFAVLKLFHLFRPEVGFPLLFELGPEEEMLTSNHLVGTGVGGIN